MTEITVKQWQNYLNDKTGGFDCPICGHHCWQTLQTNGTVDVVNVANPLYNETNSPVAVFEAALHGEQAPESPKQPDFGSFVSLLRCGHCGFLAMFDREFVEEEIND